MKQTAHRVQLSSRHSDCWVPSLTSVNSSLKVEELFKGRSIIKIVSEASMIVGICNPRIWKAEAAGWLL